MVAGFGKEALSPRLNRVLRIVFWLLFIEFLSGIVWGVHRGLYALFTREVLMITSFTQIGLVVSVFGLMKAVTNLGLGALSDRTGRRPVIILGMIVTGFGGLLIAISSSYAEMVLGTALIGLGGGGAFVGIMVSMTETLASRKGLAIGLFELAAYGGSSFGSALAGYLAVSEGLRQPFYITVVLSGLGAAAAFFALRETRVPKKTLSVSTVGVRGSYVIALRRSVPLCIAGFSSKIMDSLVWSFLPLYLVGLRMSVGEIAAISAAFTFSWALCQPLTGHISDKFGRKGIVLAGLVISAACVLLYTLTSVFLVYFVFSLLLGVGAALFYTPLVAMVSDVSPAELEGTLLGSYRFFRDMGYFVGPILLGSVADLYGLGYASYIASGSLLIAAMILWFSSKETSQRIAHELRADS